MTETRRHTGVTFAVDIVEPATQPLKECRAHQAVREVLESDVESCSDYRGTVVAGVTYQPLLAAVYRAFSEHRPLVLTPDAVWITIAQGVAHHMLLNAERLRSCFVSHPGKLRLTVEVKGWVKGSLENPWTEAFTGWAGQIRQHVGETVHDNLVCDFGTTGPVERAASQIVLMDIFERYFHYALYCVCGIPTVTLEGSAADWERLRHKAAALRVFDMPWWLDHLLPICDQFVAAAKGQVDLKHWQSICKLRDAYGGHIINGWVAKLFPYLRAYLFGPCTKRNPIFETGEGFQTSSAPSGLSRVPFTWTDSQSGRTCPMEAVGGLLGVSQDPQTLALRPEVGWAVRDAERLDVLLGKLAAEHVTFPGIKPDLEERERGSAWPHDLDKFFHFSNGAELFGRGKSAAVRIVSVNRLDPIAWGTAWRSWYRLGWLADGSWLAINVRCGSNRGEMPPLPEIDRMFSGSERHCLAPICHVTPEREREPRGHPVIALSFTELLDRLLGSGGKRFWPDAKSERYRTAERYTAFGTPWSR